MASVYEKLLEIQRDLKAPKNQHNSFGNYDYRSKEDILEGVKPLAHERNCIVICDDAPNVLENGWVYISSTAMLVDCETGEHVSSHGFAREPLQKKGMDESQITGTAASYAGKRALGNLFAIDDTSDADSYAPPGKKAPAAGPFAARCKSCGTAYTFPEGTTREQMNACGCCERPNFAVI